MFASLSGHYPIKNPIPVIAPFYFWYLFLLSIFMSPNKAIAMKDTSSVSKKRSIGEALNSSSLAAPVSFQDPQEPLQVTGSSPMIHQVKKLRRLPHVFSRVLELPFKSDADVDIRESRSCFEFKVSMTEECCGEGEMMAHTIEIHPGVVKVVVRGCSIDALDLLQTDQLKLDTWRFRLPATTLPDKATAVCTGGKLLVTVPKESTITITGNGDGEGELWNGVGTGMSFFSFFLNVLPFYL